MQCETSKGNIMQGRSIGVVVNDSYLYNPFVLAPSGLGSVFISYHELAECAGRGHLENSSWYWVFWWSFEIAWDTIILYEFEVITG